MGHPGAGKIKPGENNPEVAAKWAKALALRMAGATFPQIAEQLGYAGPSGAYEAVMGALKATLREPAEEVRRMEAERLDRLMLGYWQRAVTGDADSAAMVLKIMDRRSRMLGLDAPAKVAQTTPDGKAEAALLAPGSFDRLAALMAAAQARMIEAKSADAGDESPGD